MHPVKVVQLFWKRVNKIISYGGSGVSNPTLEGLLQAEFRVFRISRLEHVYVPWEGLDTSCNSDLGLMEQLVSQKNHQPVNFENMSFYTSLPLWKKDLYLKILTVTRQCFIALALCKNAKSSFTLKYILNHYIFIIFCVSCFKKKTFVMTHAKYLIIILTVGFSSWYILHARNCNFIIANA